jgi:hypothetical protein
MTTTRASLPNLQRALAIAEQIQTLENELRSIFNAEALAGTEAGNGLKAKSKPSKATGKRFVSPEARAKMAAAQRARWAKKNGASAPALSKPAPAAKKKRVLSPEGRARIVAALKKRHAAAKKGAKAA